MSRQQFVLNTSSELDTILEHEEIVEEHRKMRKRALSNSSIHYKSSSPIRRRDSSETRSSSKIRAVLKPLNRNVRNISKMQEELKVYNQLFEDIIKQDSHYGALLSNVKSKYDSYVASICKRSNTENTQLASIREKKRTALSELKDLESELDRRRKKYHEGMKILTKNLKSCKSKERKYETLLKLLIEHGYSVDQISPLQIQQ